MNRYSLPQQLHRGGGLLFGLAMWALYLSLRMGPGILGRPDLALASWTHSLSLILLLATGWFVAELLTLQNLRWVVDTRPFWGAFVLGLIHIYVQAAMILGFVHLKEVMVTGRETFSAKSMISILVGPVAYQAWFFPFTIVALFLCTLLWGMSFRYLGGRRDYF